MTVRPGLPPLHRFPLLWLLLASGLTALLLWQGDRLVPVRDPDTVSYEHTVLPQHGEHDEDIAGDRLRLALGSTRTLAYPAFLELVASFDPDYGWLPRIHWLLFTLAVVYFWHAAAVFSGSRWFALAVALPLVFPSWLPYLGWVMPEALAATFALAAFASLLLLARRPSSRLAWIGVAVATLLAYHTKPVLQALVVLLPLLAPLLRLTVEYRPRALIRWTAGVAAVTVLPLVLFCTLRLAVVGQFGLVAFTGYNMIGFAANSLDEDLVASLPEEHRPLANLILQERQRRGLPIYSSERPVRLWRRQLVRNQWVIAEPAAREIVTSEIASGRTPEAASEPINLLINRKLAELSSHVLRQRPGHYLEWMVAGLGHGLTRILATRPVQWLLVPLLVTLAIAWPVALLRRRAGPKTEAGVARTGTTHGRVLLGIILIATSFYLANVALIVLISWPVDRYLALASLLLPSALGGAIFTLWALALRGLGARIGRTARRWERPLARLEVAAVAVLIIAVGGWWLLDRLAPAQRAERLWIDGAQSPAARPATFFAVRDFWLPAAPSNARLLIDSETEYRLFVNRALVGSGWNDRSDRLGNYQVGDLLRRHTNRLVIELRSLDGEGSFLCRLDTAFVGRKRRTVVSDADWFTVDRFDQEMMRARGRLIEPRPAFVVASTRRWGLRPGPRLPRVDELLSAPAEIAPGRFRTGLRGGAWQAFDPLAGSRRTRVTFDWGRQVAGFLNLTFGELPAALVYVGDEPPDPRSDRARALARGFSGSRTWTDTRPRRFRYATVVSTVRVTGAWVDAMKPEWAARLIVEQEPPAAEPLSSPALEEIWRELEQTSRRSRP